MTDAAANADHAPNEDHAPGEFAPDAKQAVYEVIALRRDVRNFRPGPVPEAVVRRILEAAHRAGSVGLMQPWDFVLLRTAQRKAEAYALFRRATERAATHYDDDRRATYGALKLQGILDAPLCICVTCDTTRGGPHVLGRDSIPEMDRYSTCLAVQNLWLAARAEGVGVGWVSIVDNAELARMLELPAYVVPVAFLCLGYPVEFSAGPMLEATGWRARLPLDALIHEERWDARRSVERPHADTIVRAHPHASDVDVDARASRPPLPAFRDRIHVADPDGVRGARVRARLDALAMPRGSMGRVEALAIRLAAAQGRDAPRATRRRVLVFAGDHGVAAEGVSAYRPDVTARLCYNMVAGGAVVNALLRAQGCETQDPGARAAALTVEVIDVGVTHTFGNDARVRAAKVRRGTRNLATQSAMTQAEVIAAIDAGAASVLDGAACDVLAVGEVGIGNTTSAAALLALLTGTDADAVVGSGTGVGTRTRARKVAVVARALARVRSGGDADTADPLEYLARVGGLEIAALCGAILAAAERRVPVVLDGFITGVAALLAVRLVPQVADYLVASHRSAERAHGMVLAQLGLEPLFALDLRLGEASGAVLALPLLQAACALLTDVRTFEEAGIDPPIDARGTE